MIVTNENGEEQTTFNAGEGFKVRIPTSEVDGKSISCNIEIEENFDIPFTIVYEKGPERNEISSEKDFLKHLMGNAYIPKDCITYKTLSTNLSLNFTEQIGNLNVKVIDSSTGDNLSKAEIVIYDNKNNIVYRYETTEKDLNIILPVGDYTVKQTVTPPNYEAKTIETRVKVTENNTAEAVLENIPLVSVPDTNKTAGYMPVVGFMVLIMGILILGVIIKNKKHE